MNKNLCNEQQTGRMNRKKDNESLSEFVIFVCGSCLRGVYFEFELHKWIWEIESRSNNQMFKSSSPKLFNERCKWCQHKVWVPWNEGLKRMKENANLYKVVFKNPYNKFIFLLHLISSTSYFSWTLFENFTVWFVLLVSLQ